MNTQKATLYLATYDLEFVISVSLASSLTVSGRMGNLCAGKDSIMGLCQAFRLKKRILLPRGYYQVIGGPIW
ncbi:MAG TPA: hypothetical protein VH415_07935 [Nitrososphaeraceae archaeon]|jgi:hypothetical protein